MTTSPMSIGFVRHSILNRGGDRTTLIYAGYLAEKGYDVTIWVSRIDTLFKFSPLIKIKRITSDSKLGTIRKVILGKFPCDILIADIIAMVSFLSLRNHHRLVYYAQDYDEAYYSSKLMRWLIRILYFYALRLMGIPVIASSTNVTDLLHSRFKAKVRIVFNGVDFKEFYYEPDPILLKEKDNKRAILIFARKDYRKGLDIALNILKRISKEKIKNEIVLWVVGEEVNIPALAVKNFGFVRPDTLRRLFSSADIFLFSTRHEGLSHIVLESMVCGCPVVTTTAVEIAINRENALVSEPDEEEKILSNLKEALWNEELRLYLRNNGFKTAQKFDLNKSKEQFEKELMLVQRGLDDEKI